MTATDKTTKRHIMQLLRRLRANFEAARDELVDLPYRLDDCVTYGGEEEHAQAMEAIRLQELLIPMSGLLHLAENRIDDFLIIVTEEEGVK
jgi:hypothetical protein